MDIRYTLCLSLLLGFAMSSPKGGYPLGPKTYWIDMPIDHFSAGGNSPTY